MWPILFSARPAARLRRRGMPPNPSVTNFGICCWWKASPDRVSLAVAKKRPTRAGPLANAHSGPSEAQHHGQGRTLLSELVKSSKAMVGRNALRPLVSLPKPKSREFQEVVVRIVETNGLASVRPIHAALDDDGVTREVCLPFTKLCPLAGEGHMKVTVRPYRSYHAFHGSRSARQAYGSTGSALPFRSGCRRWQLPCRPPLSLLSTGSA